METQRQKKIAGILQKDLAEILQRAAVDAGLKGLIISVSKVNVTSDLSIAKVYVSIFPVKEARVPELQFLLDDSLEYIDQIEKSLQGGDNPIENPDLLPRRKKS